MGRWGFSGKQEADSLHKISASFLKKEGYFNDGWRSGTITWSRNGERTGRIGMRSLINENEQYVNLTYTQTDNTTGEKKDFDYKIPLTTTPCYFGGKRFWFTCPWHVNAMYCGRRVGVLYRGGDFFACRHCYDLTYSSKNRTRLRGGYLSSMSIPEVEEAEREVKRKFYKGKETRKYKRFLRKERRLELDLITAASYFRNI